MIKRRREKQLRSRVASQSPGVFVTPSEVLTSGWASWLLLCAVLYPLLGFAGSVELRADSSPGNPCNAKHAKDWILENTSNTAVKALVTRISTVGGREIREVIAEELAAHETRDLGCSISPEGTPVSFEIRSTGSAVVGVLASRPIPVKGSASRPKLASIREHSSLPMAGPIGAPAHTEMRTEAAVVPPPPPSRPQPLPENDGAAGPVDTQLAALPQGSAVVAAPHQVTQYQTFSVTLHLSKEALDALLEDVRRASDSNSNVVGITGVRMSDKMTAELISGDCTVLGDSPKWLQAVSERDETIWPWRVQCNSAGDKMFTVRLNTLLEVQGSESPRIIDVSDVPIHVSVNELGWAARNWQWILTTLLLPPLAWAAKRWLAKKGANS
jgi:hypothetical protein